MFFHNHAYTPDVGVSDIGGRSSLQWQTIPYNQQDTRYPKILVRALEEEEGLLTRKAHWWEYVQVSNKELYALCRPTEDFYDLQAVLFKS